MVNSGGFLLYQFFYIDEKLHIIQDGALGLKAFRKRYKQFKMLRHFFLYLYALALKKYDRLHTISTCICVLHIIL